MAFKSKEAEKEYKARWFREHYVPRQRQSRLRFPCSTEGCSGMYAWSNLKLCKPCSKRTWHQRNPETHRRLTLSWSKANRPKKNSIQNRRRAAGGNFPAEAWEALVFAFGHLCAYCHQRISRLEQDHIIPLARGELHVAGNIVPACRSCNASKGAH